MTEALRGRGLAISGILAAVLTTLAVIGIFFVAPEDADQGIIQKIFYFHVAIAIASLGGFLVACIAGLLYLRRREEKWDELSATSIAIALLFSILVVITGSIWAKASWGTWWVWSDVRLVTYVIVVLLYAAYFVLRSSAEGERKMRHSAIFAIAAFASVPLSFYSVRVANSFVHPVVFTRNGANMPGSMLVWFVVSLLAMFAVFATLVQLQMSQNRADRALRRLKAALEA